MAMGRLMKAHHHGHGSSNRGKPYGLMLLMAFGAAMIGVMVLHKFRERRIFNLLVKEKDRELTTLQLLLQKERDHAREVKWKLEEMKTEVNTLRTQKRGLDSRIVEMQSTIYSLREEQKTIELTLEEKQNEIKIMRERQTGISNTNPQVKALSETSRQRESEVEGMKNRLETSVKVWSVSTDDPSNASIDHKTKTSLTERDQTNVSEGNQASGELHESTDPKVADNTTEHAYSRRSETAKYENEEQTTQGEDRGENGKVSVESTEEIREYTQKVDDPKESAWEHGSTNFGDNTDVDEGKNIDNSQSGEALGMQENNNIAKIEAIGNHDDELQRSIDGINEGQTTDDEVLQTRGQGLQGRTSNTQGVENQESGISYKGGMKLEMPDSPQIGQYRIKGNHYLKKTKRKRRNIIHRSKESMGNSANNGGAVMRDKSFVQGNPESGRDGYNESSTMANESGSEHHEVKISDNLQTGEGSKLEVNEQVEVKEVSGQKQAEKDAEDSIDIPQGTVLLKHDQNQFAEDLSQDRNTTSYLKVEKRQIMNDTSNPSELEHISLKDTPANMTIHIQEETSFEAKEQEQPEKQATHLQQPDERIDAHKEDEVSEQAETVDDEDPENPGMEDIKETESESDASRESTSNSDTDEELNFD